MPMEEFDIRSVENDIRRSLEHVLLTAGIYCRVFSRSKTMDSICRKLESGKGKYSSDGKKMQDIIGVRVIFYFWEDIDVICDFLRHQPDFIDESNTYKELSEDPAYQNIGNLTTLTDKLFMPTRLNLVFRMSDVQTLLLRDALSRVRSFDVGLIDNTYEVQLRSVLSEGWHEVEHDLRYKSKHEPWWQKCEAESRMLNGIYASLETSEHAMTAIFASMAQKNMQGGYWEAMVRNHFCLHFIPPQSGSSHIEQWLSDLFTHDHSLPTRILRIHRNEVIPYILRIRKPYPLTMMNLLYIVNRIRIRKPEIIRHEPSVIKTRLDELFCEGVAGK